MNRLALYLILTLTGTAGAQTWTLDGPFTDQLLGCVRTAIGTVACTITSTYTGPQETRPGLFFASNSQAFTPEGRAISATTTAVADKPADPYSTIVAYKNIAIKVVYTFDYPKKFNTIRALYIDKGKLENVPINSGNAAAMPSTPQTAPVNLGSTQAVVGGKAYTITLTNCKASSGSYVCTSTLQPLR